jgi:hypothetical protein
VRFNKTTTIITAVTVVGTLLGDAPAALAATPEKPTSATYNTARYIEKKNKGKGKQPQEPEANKDGTVDGPHEIREINWDLRANSDHPDDALASQYNTMINTLRANAGDIYRGDVRATTRNRNRILVINVNLPNTSGPLTLYYSAPNMYLRGWGTTDNNGVIHVHTLSNLAIGQGSASSGGALPVQGPGQYDLANHLSNAGYGNQHYTAVYPSGFGDNYQDLQDVAGGEGARQVFQRMDLKENLVRLQEYGTPHASASRQQIAAALLNIIGATAEAARFGGVSAVVTDAMRDPHNRSHILPFDTYALETDWGDLSKYGEKVTRYPNISGSQSERVGVTDIWSWHDVATRAALLMGTAWYAKTQNPGKKQ